LCVAYRDCVCDLDVKPVGSDGDAIALTRALSVMGEVYVIDVDAAKGTGSNAELVKSM
jgi:uncharacterized protein related to proFAR isomerase